jgi:hypothetical protein
VQDAGSLHTAQQQQFVECLSDVPEGSSLLEQINFAVENSEVSKLSVFSFIFLRQIAANRFNWMGVVIKEAEIVDAFSGDSCLVREGFHVSYTPTGNSIAEILVAERTGHNELILRNAEVAGIYVNGWFEDCPPMARLFYGRTELVRLNLRERVEYLCGWPIGRYK